MRHPEIRSVRVDSITISDRIPGPIQRTVMASHGSVCLESLTVESAMEYLRTRPLVGEYKNGVFGVTANFSSLLLLPFLAPKQRIPVLEESLPSQSDIVGFVIERELVSCSILFKSYAVHTNFINALWESAVPYGGLHLFPTKLALASFSGINRRYLSPKKHQIQRTFTQTEEWQ